MNNEVARVFIGYDRRMPVLFHVASHSIISRSSIPVSVIPLAMNNLGGIFKRELNPNQSTEFSFTRFLTPYLSDYSGWSLFMDNDMLFLDDIAKLFAEKDPNYAVQVVKHDHKPKDGVKFLGEKQTSYEKKNWSSVILFNNDKCRALTPDYVNTASGLQLHQFKWLNGDENIGELPHRWNHLVDYDPLLPESEVSNLHYTSGGPYFNETIDCDYAEQWLKARSDLLEVEQRKLDKA